MSQYYWRLAVYANPAADVPTFAQGYDNHAELRRALVFEHGLAVSYVEHGIMIAEYNPANSAKTGVGFEFCKTREVGQVSSIAWIAQITKIRRHGN